MDGEEGRHVVIQFSLSKARSLNPPSEETLGVSLVVRYYILLVVANSHTQSDKLVSTLDGGPLKSAEIGRGILFSTYFPLCRSRGLCDNWLNFMCGRTLASDGWNILVARTNGYRDVNEV